MYNRKELERVGALSEPGFVPSVRSAAGLYSTAKSHVLRATPQAQFGMQSSFNPLGAVSVEAALDTEKRGGPGPCAPPNVKNPFLHHISQQKHNSYNAPHYIPPHKRHLIREYLKRSSIRFYNRVAADQRMSTTIAAARAGLTLGEEDNGKYLLLQPSNEQQTGGTNRLIKLERQSLPPHLRREFDSLAKATSDIKERDRKQKYALTSQFSPEIKKGLYRSIKNEFKADAGPPARNLKADLDFQRHNFKLGYSESGTLYPVANNQGPESQGGVNSDIANLKDFEGMLAPGTPLRTRSMSPGKAEPYLHSPTVLGGKIQMNYEFVNPRPFQATKENMKNVKNESSAVLLSQAGHQRRISASQSTATFVRHNAPPPKTPAPGLTFQSNVTFNQFPDKRSKSLVNGRPDSAGSLFSSFTSNKLWEKYEKIGAKGPLTGPGSPQFSKIKKEGTNKHFRFGATYQISPNDKSFSQTFSHAQHSGVKESKEISEEEKQKRQAILDFMHRRHLPLGSTSNGPPTTIQADALDKETAKAKLAGKKVPPSQVQSLGVRNEDGREIGDKVLGSSLPIDQVKWKEGPPSMGVTSSFFPEKQNSDLAIHNATNKYFRAAQMAHYHRMGMKDEEKNTEKRVSFAGAVPTASEQEFTRRANKEHIEKQHFQWNKSFDAVNETKSKEFNSVGRSLDMYSRVCGMPRHKRSDTDPHLLSKTMPPAGSVVNMEGRPHRAAFMELLKKIESDAGSVRHSYTPGPGGSFLGGAPGAQFRSHFAIGNHDDSPSKIERSASVTRGVTLSEIKEENDQNLRKISKDGWSSHMVFGKEQKQKATPLYQKYFVWRQPVADI